MAAARSWPLLLNGLLDGRDLTADDTTWAMDLFVRGEATDAQIAGFVVAPRPKGETVEEITGLVHTVYEHANVPGRTVDIVGMGGDGAQTVTISAMSAIVIAGTGARVVKHGNRAASSASDASDLLVKLGVKLELASQRAAEVAEEAGVTFYFAVKFPQRCVMWQQCVGSWVVRDGTVTEETFDPRNVGIDLAPVEALRMGSKGADAS